MASSDLNEMMKNIMSFGEGSDSRADLGKLTGWLSDLLKPGFTTDTSSPFYIAPARKSGKSTAFTAAAAPVGTPYKGKEVDFVTFDEIAEMEKLKMSKMDEFDADVVEPTALEMLASNMTTHFRRFSGDTDAPAISKTAIRPVALTMMETLTTSIAGKGYSKAPHIGGEEFMPIKAYVGKRNKIIVCFKPEEVCAYNEMEMDLKDAVQKLSGFKNIMDVICEGDYNGFMKKIQTDISKEKDQKAAESKFDDYPAFGSW